MNLRLQINEDMKAAMRAKDTARLAAIRLLMAAIKQREVDERIELTDADILAVIDKMMKQRRDSFSQFEAAGRKDLADIESFEMSVLLGYMPQQLSQAEIDAAIELAISASGAASAQDMGKVMAILKPKFAGRADIGKASAQVKARLSS
ncbi:MAG: GatB/YqeY domain-containing protein [Gallionellaceae bacterium]